MAGTILVVDDDPAFAELMQALLGKQYVVQGCTDSKTALEKIHQAEPVLVLLDLQMPAPNGWELLRAIRNDPARARLPVLVVSAAGTEGYERFSLDQSSLGAIEVLAKPFEIDELRAKIASLLGWSSLDPPSSRVNEAVSTHGCSAR